MVQGIGATGSGSGETWRDFLRNTNADAEAGQAKKFAYRTAAAGAESGGPKEMGRDRAESKKSQKVASSRHDSTKSQKMETNRPESTGFAPGGLLSLISRKRGPSTSESNGKRRSTGGETCPTLPSENHGALHHNNKHQPGSSASPVDLTSPSRQLPSRLKCDKDSQGNIKPPWQLDDDVAYCHRCDRSFTFIWRKHHCRKCGKVVCANCSDKRATIPRQDIVLPLTVAALTEELWSGNMDGLERVRVCDMCYGALPPQNQSGRSSRNNPIVLEDNDGHDPACPLSRRATTGTTDPLRTFPSDRRPSRDAPAGLQSRLYQGTSLLYSASSRHPSPHLHRASIPSLPDQPRSLSDTHSQSQSQSHSHTTHSLQNRQASQMPFITQQVGQSSQDSRQHSTDQTMGPGMFREERDHRRPARESRRARRDGDQRRVESGGDSAPTIPPSTLSGLSRMDQFNQNFLSGPLGRRLASQSSDSARAALSSHRSPSFHAHRHAPTTSNQTLNESMLLSSPVQHPHTCPHCNEVVRSNGNVAGHVAYYRHYLNCPRRPQTAIPPPPLPSF